MYKISLILSVLSFVSVAFYFFRSPQFSVFHPLTLYIAFHGLIFVVRPILSHILDYELIYKAYQFTPSASDKITVIVASNLGFLVFAATCWRSGNKPIHFRFDRAASIERASLLPFFAWVMLVCVPIGAYSLSLAWTSASETGIANAGMVRDAATGITINTEANGYLMDAQLMLASSAAIFAWFCRFRLLALVPLLAFIIFRAGTGGRGPFVAALGAVILLYLFERRQKMASLRVIAIVPAIILFFAAVGQDRGSAIREFLGNEEPVMARAAETQEKFLEGMDYGNMEYFEYLVYVVPQRSGTYGYFTDLLQIFTEPIPRAMWKDKPIGAPFQRVFLFDYGYPIGMTRSIPGQGWFSMGWIGVALWSGIWGAALGAIYNRFASGQQGTLSVLSYMIFLSTLPLSYRDGQLLSLVRQCAFFLAPIGLWWAFARMNGLASIAHIRRNLAKSNGAMSWSSEKLTMAQQQLPEPVARRRRLLRGTSRDEERPPRS